MSHRSPLSGLKKRLKRRLTGSRDDPQRKGADGDGEGVSSGGSLLQPGSYVVANSGCDSPRSGNEGGRGRGRADSMDLPPHSDSPGFVPVSDKGYDNGEEANRRDLYLCSGVGGVMGSGPSQEGSVVDREKLDQVDPPKSSPSISDSRGSKGTETAPYFSCCI